MILYHGSNIEIDKIELDKCRPYKDFGKGFYLTTILEQAAKMAARVARIYGGIAVVTEYELDETFYQDKSIKYRTFEVPTKEWAIFVINNRNRDYDRIDGFECNHDCKYDVVTGPIANDDLALLFRQFSNGLIGAESLAREMKYKQLTNQYSFHTKKSLHYLRKVGVHFE